MSISGRYCCSYVGVVPDDPATLESGWIVRETTSPRRRRDDEDDQRLVGFAPRLTITDDGVTPTMPLPTSSPFSRPRLRRSRVSLAATSDTDASTRAAYFHVAAGLTESLRPRDVLHLVHTSRGGLGLSVLRDGRLIAAAAAVDAVPLGSISLRVPYEIIAEVKGVLRRHDPEFTYGDLFHELPIDVTVRGRRRLRYRGRFELGGYDFYVGHGPYGDMPGVDMCVGITLMRACSPVAVNCSAQLIDIDGLTIEYW